MNDFNPLLDAAGTTNARVTYPAVVAEVEGVKCPPLLDKGGGSSYASATLLNRISTRNRTKEVTEIEILLGSSPQKVQMVTIEIGEINRKFAMPVKVTKVDKGKLLFPDNPNYEETIAKSPYLSRVVMNDQDKKSRLPVHPIRGSGECTKLKTESVPKIGEPGEHVTELTKFGWVFMSPGKEPRDITNMPWRGNHPLLPSNREGSLRRTAILNRKLTCQNLTSAYQEIILEQREAGMVEKGDRL